MSCVARHPLVQDASYSIELLGRITALFVFYWAIDAILPIMIGQFQYRSYARRFNRPLHTHHGLWHIREGIILRLSAPSGAIAWGEIAPLPWFGTETLLQAWDFCERLEGQVTEAAIATIPDHLPACQFGFESAWDSLTANHHQSAPALGFPTSYLLPAGPTALTAWNLPYAQGYRTFKWKIGMADAAEELALGQRLLEHLPADAQLRLDANGGLTDAIAHQWLAMGDRQLQSSVPQARVEFLEQPLPPDQVEQMQHLADRYQTPLALDESVRSVADLEHCYQQGWRDVVVIKPAIAGSPRRLQQFCQSYPVDLVWSTVFETAIARQYIQTHLIAPGWAASSRPPRAVGFGVGHWFDDATEFSSFEALWQAL